mmetsp:Transcript_1496/g.6542  ORF Transcript_1496/g.6542 Transcript_1496/m.6542 type:complete len:325 (-) Transcript_1496:108-1082(-)
MSGVVRKLSGLGSKLKEKLFGTTASAAAEKIVIMGASGYVGQSTTAALSADPRDAQIVAMVRNPDSEKAAPLKALQGVEVVAGDMGNADSLGPVLEGATKVFIVVPGHIERTQLAVAAIEACVSAGVGHILVLSVCSAEKEGTVFGDQFTPIEAKAKEAGISYTIMRLPMFLDNQLGNIASVKGQKMLYGPIPAEAVLNSVAVQDVGVAAATLLHDSDKYTGQTVVVSGPPSPYNDIGKGLTEALGTEVGYTVVPYEAAKEAFMGLGLPEWQVDGVLELYKLVEAGDPVLQDAGDFEKIVGRPAMTPVEWCHANKAMFADDDSA